MLLVLTGVTAISVALLAYVNELTKGPIAEANAKTLNEALKKVLPEFTNNPVAESDTIFSEKDGKKNVDFIVYPAKKAREVMVEAVMASTAPPSLLTVNGASPGFIPKIDFVLSS